MGDASNDVVMSRIVKTDVDGLVKDTYSGAVLSVDYDGLRAYKIRRAKIKADALRLDRVERDVSDIKSMLTQLINMASKESGEK